MRTALVLIFCCLGLLKVDAMTLNRSFCDLAPHTKLRADDTQRGHADHHLLFDFEIQEQVNLSLKLSPIISFFFAAILTGFLTRLRERASGFVDEGSLSPRYLRFRVFRI